MKRNYVVIIRNDKGQQVAEFNAQASSATMLHKDARAEAVRMYGELATVSVRLKESQYADPYHEDDPVANGYADYLEYFYGEDR